MCQTVNCRGCQLPFAGCSLVDGFCATCRGKQAAGLAIPFKTIYAYLRGLI